MINLQRRAQRPVDAPVFTRSLYIYFYPWPQAVSINSLLLLTAVLLQPSKNVLSSIRCSAGGKAAAWQRM